MTTWEAFFNEWMPLLEAEMRAAVGGPAHPSERLFYGMLAYHLGWVDAQLQPARHDAGKRIRPMLCLLACAACGGDPARALPAAAAIELLHNFSLIHDDIQDRSETRRGRPTVWALWGIAQAINAGDALFTIAHQALWRLRGRGVPAERILEVAERFDAACLMLTRGQHFDLSFEEAERVSIEGYLEMIRGKTAALLQAAVGIGARLADRPSEDLEAFGEALGLAFQIQDDLLGIWGDPAVTGKSAADDLQARKKTLPVIITMERVPEFAERYRDPQTPLEILLRDLERSGARAEAETMAAVFTQQAMAALERAGLRNPYGEALRDLARALLSRTR
ncbi:polyprenyl synthetase family protein [Thermoflexus sp.]|uniref:polyprenyl synthetase family protein n=1 Tax=Thermoflexus sp. TaxID=1969742 RepID=UPI0025D4DD35|nr:polyprenyl synthetase family protein [Thermoflexus sp.]MDW8180128.1 polyprenyl synthetase family protein [Anaerolineae bacterium]MCS6962635.1 polyprenyl synthetase family protein [Thermoflexus sp.]MCS7350677.1 polyprenyl synthetase family protein [Thermoflexus sp.]MCX7690637.1 polyprenyl synthetase family protein [Thermoflexus sp.]MDW8185420.1 polyprenyl synthetase family protein [Anaerolineae bacterium]